MPNFPTVEAAREWCDKSFPAAVYPTHDIHWWSVAFWTAVVVGSAYALYRFVPVVWSDLKSIWTSATSGFKAGVAKVEAAV